MNGLLPKLRAGFDEEVPNKVGKEGSHLPISRPTLPSTLCESTKLELGKLIPEHDFNERSWSRPKPRFDSSFNPLLRQLTIILDSVFIGAARKTARHGQKGDLIEEIAYRWHKGRLAAEDEYYRDLYPKDFDEENDGNKKTKT